MKCVYFAEESSRKERYAFADEEISTLGMCLAAFMTLIVLLQVFCWN